MEFISVCARISACAAPPIPASRAWLSVGAARALSTNVRRAMASYRRKGLGGLLVALLGLLFLHGLGRFLLLVLLLVHALAHLGLLRLAPVADAAGVHSMRPSAAAGRYHACSSSEEAGHGFIAGETVRRPQQNGIRLEHQAPGDAGRRHDQRSADGRVG